ncbi:DUF1294 domain-containing protein [Novosphingobium sp.]|uniref:DUF1294 domain-containing protein n=1 Tax=Novosphingobium sp. TaxID=1874826 RepID=UPI0035B49D30
MLPLTDHLIEALCAINFAAFAAFGIDKARAENGGWRIRESTLLWLAFLGGSPGAWAGRGVFRHKTRKQPFNGWLLGVTAAQLAALGLWLGWSLG